MERSLESRSRDRDASYKFVQGTRAAGACPNGGAIAEEEEAEDLSDGVPGCVVRSPEDA